MTTLELEKRLTALEAEVGALKQQAGSATDTTTKSSVASIPWWQEISGVFKDDPIFDEAMRLGREWRLSQCEDYDKNIERR